NVSKTLVTRARCARRVPPDPIVATRSDPSSPRGSRNVIEYLHELRRRRRTLARRRIGDGDVLNELRRVDPHGGERSGVELAADREAREKAGAEALQDRFLQRLH